MKRILAFGCHPDDIEFMAAGTLALLAERGWEVHLATMTGGEVGSPNRASHEIRATRLAEAEAAAKVLGATYHFAGGHDLEVTFDHAYRQRATRVVRIVRPDVVLTHAPYDYLIDHEETSRLVRTAAYIASVPLYDCGDAVPATTAIPHLYYWDAYGGVDIFGRPLPLGFGVDVGLAIETKRRMLASHASQREWLAFVSSIDSYLDEMVRMTRAQGARIGRPYGECFLQHLGHGHPKDNILAQELGDLVVPIAN